MQEFEIIKRVRAMLEATPASTASAGTLAGYKREVKRLAGNAHGDIGGLLAAARETAKSRTWYRRRAALVHVTRTMLEQLMQKQTAMQREAKDDAWSDVVKRMGNWADAFQDMIDAKPPEVLTPRRSKRASLAGLPPDWRRLLVDRVPTYRDPALVCAVTGCRPAELETGVQLRIEGGMLVARIDGAKVREKQGQPWRELAWNLESENDLVRELVTKVAGAGGLLTVATASGKRFSDALAKASARIWPKRREPLTAYSFRHAAAADMKASGLPPDEISAALGHASDVTKSMYGHARQGSRGGVAPARVKAAKQVKRKATHAKPARVESRLHRSNAKL